MFRNLLLTAVLLAPLCACSQTGPDDHTTVATPSTAGKPTTTCPAPTFDGFFKRFADDVALQKIYVTDPLQSDSIDPNAEPEPATVTKSVAKASLSYPLMPDTATQTTNKLVVTTHHDASDISVQITKPDTDDQRVFHFRPTDGCWTLYRVEDQSL